MAIIIPGQKEQVHPMPGGAVTLPEQGQGLAALAKGFQTAGGQALEAANAKIQADHANEVARQKAIKEAKERQDTRDLVNAELAFHELTRQTRSGFLTRQGHNARGATQEFTEKMNQNADDIMSTIQDEGVRVKFSQNVLSTFNSELDNMSKYEAAQVQGAHIEDLKSYQNNAVEDGISYYDPKNPGASEAQIVNIRKINDELAKNSGWDSETAKDKLRISMSKMHAGIINNLNVFDPEAAGKYFEEHKDEILPSVWDELTGKIQNADYTVGGQKVADAAMDKFTTWPERYDYVKANAKPGKQRTFATEMVEHAEAREKQQLKEKKAQFEEDARGLFVKSGFNVDAMLSTPEGRKVWNELDGSVKEHMVNSQKNFLELRVGDPGSYDALQKEAVEHPDVFMQRDLLDPRYGLNKELYLKLQNERDKIAKGLKAGDFTLEQELDAATAGMDKTTAEGRAASGRFRFLVENMIEDRKTKGPFSDQDRKDLVQSLAVQESYKAPGVWGYIFGGKDKTASVGEILSDPKKAEQFKKSFTIDKIDTATQMVIRGQLEAEGEKATDENVVKRYLIKKYRIY